MNQSNKGVWIGVAVVVVAALGLWWLASNQSLALFGSLATTTTPASPTPAGTGATGPTSPSGNAAGSIVDSKNKTVATIVSQLSGATQFQSWFTSTGVSSQVTGTGPYTIFVPTDGSVSQQVKGTITNLTAAEKKRLVQYHIISGRGIDVDQQVAGTIQSLSGDSLNFGFGTNKIPMVNSAIIVTQYNGSNGVVYVIDNVLLPPQR